MAAYTATCPVCGRRYETTDVEGLRYCSVGCAADASVGPLIEVPDDTPRHTTVGGRGVIARAVERDRRGGGR